MEATQTETKTIEQMLVELARARRDCAAQGAILGVMIAALEALPEYRAASELKERYKAQVEQLTEEIKQMAVAAYDGENKTITPGVKIQERTVATLLDQEAARKYAFDNAPGLLKLDETGLGRLAAKLYGTPAALAFCEIKKEPTATIATDLDKIIVDSNMAF